MSIEAAASPNSAASATSPLFGSSSPTAFDMAMPPGSVGAQGMGGFPVRVNSSMSLPQQSSGAAYSRNSSFSSFDSGYGSAPPTTNAFEPPSTLNMLSISQSSAPAPTFDDVYNFGGQKPPLAPPNRKLSNDSWGSAPPPSSAPPPPPASAPPPPGGFGAMVPSTSGSPSPYALAPAPSSGGYAMPPAPYAPSPYGNPSSTNPFAPQQQSPYGQPPPPQNYGQPPPPQNYGQPPQGTNPFAY